MIWKVICNKVWKRLVRIVSNLCLSVSLSTPSLDDSRMWLLNSTSQSIVANLRLNGLEVSVAGVTFECEHSGAIKARTHYFICSPLLICPLMSLQFGRKERKRVMDRWVKMKGCRITQPAAESEVRSEVLSLRYGFHLSYWICLNDHRHQQIRNVLAPYN